jgi:drug/metabolite transporter (DMT)-like permease
VSWFLLALTAGVASALNVWVSKLLVTGRLSPVLVGGVVHLWGALLCALALPFAALRAEWSAGVLLGLLGVGVVAALGNALYFLALSRSQLSEIDLFLRTSALWTFLGGALLGEPSQPRTWVGAALIVASVALVSQQVSQQRDWRLAQGHALALGAALAFGAGNLLDKALSAHFDPLGYTALNLGLTGLGMLALARPGLRDLRQPALWGGSAWLVATTFALTQLLIILAFAAGGSAGQVILVAQVRLVALLAVGILVLGERDRLARKLTASALMLAGLLALYGV